MYGPLSELSNVNIIFSTSAVCLKKVFAYLDMEQDDVMIESSHEEEEENEEEDTNNKIPKLMLTDVVGAIQFQNVYFRYPTQTQAAQSSENNEKKTNDDGKKKKRRKRKSKTAATDENDRSTSSVSQGDMAKWVLNDISIQFKEGQLTVIMGSNGSGKTTLAHLIMGFNRPTAGWVSVDGHDISQIDGQSLISKIGLLTQESYIMNDTIRNNLLLAKDDASGECPSSAFQ